MADDLWAEFRTGTRPAADDPWTEFRKQEPSVALDVAKQIPSGLALGAEAIPAAPAQALGFIGRQIERFFPGDPEARQRREELLKVIEENRKGGIASLLPKAETPEGEVARDVSQFIPGFVLGGAKALAPGQTVAQYAKTEAPRIAGLAGAGATAGLTSQAAGAGTAAVAGEEYRPVGELVGGLIGGTTALRRVETAATKRALPEIEKQTAEYTGKLYDQFRASGLSYRPQVGQNFSQTIKGELHAAGLTDSDQVASGTWKALTNALENKAAVSPQDFHSLYQELGHVAKSPIESQRLAARQAQERLLQLMENTPQGALTGNVNAPAQAVAALREANQNWAALKRAEAASKRIAKAEDVAGSTFSGLNFENQLRQKFAPMINPLRPMPGLSPHETETIRQFVRGTGEANKLRYIGNFLGGGGGSVGGAAASALGAGGGAGLSYLTGGDPLAGSIIGSGAPLAGLGLRLAANRGALTRARAIEELLLSRSPYAAPRLRAVNPAYPVAPAIAGATTLSTLGE
jgi:hypothetical protein